MQVHLSQARDEKNVHIVYHMKMSKNLKKLHTTMLLIAKCTQMKRK